MNFIFPCVVCKTKSCARKGVFIFFEDASYCIMNSVSLLENIGSRKRTNVPRSV